MNAGVSALPGNQTIHAFVPSPTAENDGPAARGASRPTASRRLPGRHFNNSCGTGDSAFRWGLNDPCKLQASGKQLQEATCEALNFLYKQGTTL